jgi:hypothetical protein
VSTFDSTVLAGGAHAGASLAWRPGRQGWTLFASADVGVLAGNMHSATHTHFTPFLDSLYTSYGSSAPQDYGFASNRTEWVVNPRLELGVGWDPPALP